MVRLKKKGGSRDHGLPFSFRECVPREFLICLTRSIPKSRYNRNHSSPVRTPVLLACALESGEMSIRIDCYLSPECASEPALKHNLAFALEAEKLEAQVAFHRLDDETAMTLGVTGSPSIYINGQELQPLGVASFA